MKAFWEIIEAKPVNNLYERTVDLLGDLYFSPKSKVGEIELDKIQMEDLSRLFHEIQDIPTIEEERLMSDLSVAHFCVLEEAAMRRNAAVIAWQSAEKNLKKKTFF